MNNHPRNSATLREKSRRRLLRRIEKCNQEGLEAKLRTMKVSDEGELAHFRSQQTKHEKQLARLKESLAIKSPAPMSAEAPAPKLKKPRAKKITEIVPMELAKSR